MFSIPPPDNFFFFVIKFAVSISLAVYLLNSYHRTRILLINAFLFFFLAIRICTEYYLPQVESFEVANNIARFHAIILLITTGSFWACVYYYVRPFHKFRREQLIDKLFGIFFLILPHIIIAYWFILRKVHYLRPEKLEGYWVFRIYENIETKLYSIYNYGILFPLIIVILCYAIYRDQKNRFRNLLLLIGYVAYVFISQRITIADNLSVDWSVPNFAHLYLIYGIMITWFLSGYRLFEDGTRSQTADLLNSISDIAISTDKQLNVIYVNSIGKIRFGDISGTLSSFLSSRSNALGREVETRIDDLIANKNSISLELVDKEDVKGTFEIKSAKLSRGIQEIGYTFLLTDLTLERKRLSELEALNKTKDQLFSIIAHDLRKPALAFQGVGKKIDYLILKDDHTQLSRFTKAIDTASLNLSSVLDNLLNWARGQKELPTHMHKSQAHLAAICNDVLALFQGMIDNKALTILNLIDEDLTYLVDVNAFSTIIRNLTDNAIKFTPVGCEIVWSSAQDDKFLYLKIEDEGIGMTEEQIQQFYNSSVVSAANGIRELSGVGLGLQFVMDIVKSHNGTIKIHSVDNRGTMFTLIFPIEAG